MKSLKAIAAFVALAAAVAAANQHMSEGEIRKVDPAAKKITINSERDMRCTGTWIDGKRQRHA